MFPLSHAMRAVALACCVLPACAHAQPTVSRTAGGGTCASAGNNLSMLVEQDLLTLNTHLDRVTRYVQDVAQLEICAARQMVWVRGHPSADASGCIDVEQFRGEPGPPGPQGVAGVDAVCP